LVKPLKNKDTNTTFNGETLTSTSSNVETFSEVVKEEIVKEETTETVEVIEEEVEEVDAPILQESQTEIEIKVEESAEVSTENDEPKTQQKQTYSAIKLCIDNINSLIKKMYDGVFNKNANFKPTMQETVNDLIEFIAVKCLKVGVYEKFAKEFTVDKNVIDALKEKGDYVPYVIKLTAFIDAQTKSNCTSLVIKDLTKIFVEYLSDNANSTQIITSELNAIYSYALLYGIKFM
jgi:hypothetical protein